MGQYLQGVAGHDGRPDPEHRPDRRPVVAFGVGVDDVVVDEREVVHQLHRHPAGYPTSASAQAASAARMARVGRIPLPPGGLHRLAVGVGPTHVVGRPGGGSPGPGGRCGALMAGRDGPAGAGQDLGDADGGGHATSSSVVTGARCRAPRAGPGRRRRPRRRARSLSSSAGRPAAAYRPLHGRRPAGVGPRPGHRQAGQRGPRPGAGARPCPGPARKVARRSLVTTESSTRRAVERVGKQAGQLGGDPADTSLSGRRPSSSSAAESETARYCGPAPPRWRPDGACGRRPTATGEPVRP